MPTPIGVPEPPLGEDVVDLMLACHVRIRHFLGVARAVGRGEAASEADLRDACERTRRYFLEALPRHVADENESVLPRLRGRSASLDAALAAMHLQHTDHAPVVDALVRLLDRVALDPASPARRASVSRCAEALTVDLERHLAAEETHVFPAMRALLSDAERTQILTELRARRRQDGRVQVVTVPRRAPGEFG
jgi:hemerythrin-like domain-containing protein